MLGVKNEGSGSGADPGTTVYTQAQGGCRKSLNGLMQRHEGLVHYVVQRQWLCSVSYEEALQAGRQGLWRAIMGYDTGRGTAFATYAYKAIMRQVWLVVKREQRRMEREVPERELRLYCYETGADPAWLKEQEEIRESVLKLVKRLPKRLDEVITGYYGLEGEEGQTLEAIGEELGVSTERVRQLRNEALVWLGQPAHSQELRHMLARHSQQEYELADQLAQAWLKQRGGRNGRE